MDRALGLHKKSQDKIRKGRFQSLFWWIGLWGQIPLDLELKSSDVSILVLVDRALGRRGPGRDDPVINGFQSLFWWIGLWGPAEMAKGGVS